MLLTAWICGASSARQAGGAGTPGRAGSSAVVQLSDLETIYGLDFRASSYLRAAERLLALSKDERLGAMVELARRADQQSSHQDKVIVLCRMLFEAKPGRKFRRPMLGGASFLGGTNYSDWPLEPICLVKGVPFLIVTGYLLAGASEDATPYLRYCVRDCRWTSQRFRKHSSTELRSAVNALMASRKWKSPLAWGDRQFLVNQIR